VTKPYRPYTPTPAFLFPPSQTEWLPDDNLAHFVMYVVGQLDLSAIHSRCQEAAPRGTQSYHPLMMTGFLVYGYWLGVASSRKIEKSTYENVAFRVIAGNEHPDHTRISEFRRVHLNDLADLFFQVLALAKKAHMVKLGNVALDGTKVKANASKHKAMDYDRMGKDAVRLRHWMQLKQRMHAKTRSSARAAKATSCPRISDVPKLAWHASSSPRLSLKPKLTSRTKSGPSTTTTTCHHRQQKRRCPATRSRGQRMAGSTRRHSKISPTRRAGL
jgi:transposase